MIIDKFRREGQTWYHLSGYEHNDPEYKKFYEWYNRIPRIRIEDDTDFPHHSWRFNMNEDEKEMLSIWGEHISEEEE